MGQKNCLCSSSQMEESYEESYFRKSTELQSQMTYRSLNSTIDTVKYFTVYDPKISKKRKVPELQVESSSIKLRRQKESIVREIL